MTGKDIKGTTPKYTIVFRESDGTLVDPSATFDTVVIKIYNVNSDTELVKFTNEDPTPDGYEVISLGSDSVDFTIPAANTQDAESGENRIEIWMNFGSGEIVCRTAILNEFIDAKDFG